MTYLIAVLVAIVVSMVVFGGVCQKNCHSTDEKERVICRKIGGGTLLVIIGLMVTAVIMSCTAPRTSLAALPDVPDDAEEYFRSLAPYVQDAPRGPRGPRGSDVLDLNTMMSEHTVLTPSDVYARLQ